MLVANARMYAVTPKVQDAWRALFDWVAWRAGEWLTYLDHAPPAPLEELWARDDLGLAFMCGYPFARAIYATQAVAVPIPSLPRYKGQPVYCTDLVVAAQSPAQTLSDTFGGRIGWTVDHSQSGYHAVRHSLLAYRRDPAATLFSGSVGPLVTPRRVIEGVIAGTIDVGPLDSYVHDLLTRHEPETVAALRTVASTGMTPIPPLVASARLPAATIGRLRATLLGIGSDTAGQMLLEPLLLAGFAPVAPRSYDRLLAQAAEAEKAGYLVPA